MFRSCSRCGKIHEIGKECPVLRNKTPREEPQRLRSKHKWTLASRRTREEANYLCEVCKDQGKLTYKHLEVHHIEKLKDKPEKLLESDNLICLCQRHHKEADSGLLDKDYLISLVHNRGKKIPPVLEKGEE